MRRGRDGRRCQAGAGADAIAIAIAACAGAASANDSANTNPSTNANTTNPIVGAVGMCTRGVTWVGLGLGCVCTTS